MKTRSGERQAQKQASISACMIVKNEETLLPRCLGSIRDLVDEIILVDTGSDDQTVEIAGEYGCRVFNFPWTGDFSAARNESLRHSGCDWILIIDADEELPSQEIDTIRHAVNNPTHEIISISVYNKSLESGRISSFLPSVRLFRRRLELKYDGIVHNRLILPSDKQVIRSEIKLFHYGYDLSKRKLEDKKKRSMELLEKQLRENPDDVFAHFNMAQLLRGMDGTSDPDICRRIIEHAMQVINSPQTSTGYTGYRLMAHLQAATACSTLGRFEEAEKYCLAALTDRPDYVDATITLANVYLALGKTDKAQEYYLKHLDLLGRYRPEKETSDLILHYLDSRHVAWYGLATIARMKGNSTEALKYYNRIISAGHCYLDIYYQAGIIYLQQGEWRRAQEMLNRELTHNAGSAAAHLSMARLLLAQGKSDQAVGHLDSVLALEPANVTARLCRSKILLSLGSVEKCLDDIRGIINDAPQNADLMFECGNILFEAGRIDEAQFCYLKVVEFRPGHCEAANNLGNCHFRRGRFEEAISIYERLTDQSPKYRTAYRNLGMAYIRLGQNEKALNALAEYAENSPEDTEINRTLGDLLSVLGNHDRAIGCYEKYLRHHPGDSTCLFDLAEIYFRLGYHEAAEAGYRQVLISDPLCQPARERLEAISAVAAIN